MKSINLFKSIINRIKAPFCKSKKTKQSPKKSANYYTVELSDDKTLRFYFLRDEPFRLRDYGITNIDKPKKSKKKKSKK